MSMPSPLMPEQESAPPLSEPQRLINTFVAPSKTFSDLNRKPSWWAPWLIAAILALLFSYAVQQKVSFEQLAENAIKASPRMADRIERMEPAQREQQGRIMSASFKYGFYLSPIFILVFGVVIALGLMLTFNFGMGAEIPFKKALAVIFYAWLPQSVLGNIVTIASILAPGFVAESFNLENPAATNLAAFMDFATAPRALYKLAAAVDIFNIWTIILLGIGFSSVSKVKRSTAITVVVAWYVVVKLVAAAYAAKFA